MSAGKRAAEGRRRASIDSLTAQQEAGEPIVMVTAYDYPSAQLADEVGVDVVLVGDSAGNVLLGHDSTVQVSVEEMLMLTRAVRRGLRSPLLVVDLPFGSYEASDEDAVRSAQRFVKDGGADAVKLERGGTSAQRARAIIDAGIPVMGHIGLTPQSATSLGGLKVQGRTADQARRLLSDALALEDAGCFAIVLEAVPAAVTDVIVQRLSCLTIGIGAGAATDGQVLVWHDLLGLTEGHVAKFVRQFADVRGESLRGLSAYAQAVREGSFPAAEHGYAVSADELEAFRTAISDGQQRRREATGPR